MSVLIRGMRIPLILCTLFSLSISLNAMEKKPYHHVYKDGKLYAFRNLEGGPKRDPNFKWDWKVFREEKKKLKIDYPPEHVIDKQIVLKNLEKHKSESYVMWLDHASFIIKLGDTTICLLYTSPSPRDYAASRMPSSA